LTLDGLEHELSVAVGLAQSAGEEICQYYRTGLAVDRKAGDEPVTAADRASDRLIVAGLQAAFPHDGLLTEESDDDPSRLQKERVWIVDPLDGTVDFVAGTEDFVVQIALAIHGTPVLGVIYQPVTGLLYYASQGRGAYRMVDGTEERLRVSTTRDPQRMCLAASRSHYSAYVEAARKALGIESVTQRGSVGLKAGLLAQGACDLYLATTIAKEWDICAPHAVLSEAGGVITNLCGETLTYNKPDVMACKGLVASNGWVHDQIIETLAPLRPLSEG
jgi:3'(2'), 5'-bisphosphate nucleotidase